MTHLIEITSPAGKFINFATFNDGTKLSYTDDGEAKAVAKRMTKEAPAGYLYSIHSIN